MYVDIKWTWMIVPINEEEKPDWYWNVLAFIEMTSLGALLQLDMICSSQTSMWTRLGDLDTFGERTRFWVLHICVRRWCRHWAEKRHYDGFWNINYLLHLWFVIVFYSKCHQLSGFSHIALFKDEAHFNRGANFI